MHRLLDAQREGEWTPQALAAKVYDELNPSWEMAMNGPHREGYIKACEAEIKTLTDMQVWEEVEREPWMRVIPSIWAFRQKLFPDGLMRKLKARLAAGGHKQEKNVDYWDTYAPVVNWTTVRLMLILTAQLGLASRQVDYTAAFVHAEIARPPGFEKMTPDEQKRSGTYMEMPRGFAKPGRVYRLNKALYGLCDSSRQWWLHLKSNLERAGFEQKIDVDACLFVSDKVICLTYVDDSLFFARDQKDIDEVIRKLRDDQGMKLTEENDVAGFLGVHIQREDDKVTLTQAGLAQRIVTALGCDDLPAVDTPATDVLGKDEDGEPPTCTFNYASVIGMLWYLYGHSRPDIGFAVSQCARFSFCPKRSHELALIRIGQYLKGTIDKGISMKPIDTGEFRLDVYVDSDFMGLYGKEKRTDADNVKSRTGYAITLNDCPMIWASKLQEGVALSTMMAEYYALSTAMREVIPLRSTIECVAREVGVENGCQTAFKTTVWEDNMGALTLANLEPGRSTPRSKFYDCKVHWFRSHLDDNCKVCKIDTKEQRADMFTKPLARETFCYLRKLLIGW